MTVEKMPDLPRVVYAPDGHGKATLEPFSSLAPGVGNRLHEMSDKDCMTEHSHVAYYRMILKNPAHYLRSGCCATGFVRRGKVDRMSWGQANGNENRTCEPCLNKQRLCAKLVRYNGGYAFARFPLPERAEAWQATD